MPCSIEVTDSIETVWNVDCANECLTSMQWRQSNMTNQTGAAKKESVVGIVTSFERLELTPAHPPWILIDLPLAPLRSMSVVTRLSAEGDHA